MFESDSLDVLVTIEPVLHLMTTMMNLLFKAFFSVSVTLILQIIVTFVTMSSSSTQVQRFKPLVKVLDMHTYPIFSTCISITGIVANLIALYMTSSAIFPHRRASQVNSMIAAQYFYFFYVISLGSASLVTGYMLESVEYTFEVSW